jgi:hypothetical protein
MSATLLISIACGAIAFAMIVEAIVTEDDIYAPARNRWKRRAAVAFFLAAGLLVHLL